MGLQSALQAVTRHLPFFISDTSVVILGEECYTTLVYNVDPTVRCLRLFLSKGLGIGIIIFGSILKFPQIVKILRGRSARGISLTMYALEVVAYTISLAYAVRRELPISTYGENASLTVQNMIITLLIINFAPPRKKSHLALLPSNGSSVRADARKMELLLAASSMVLGSLFLFLPSLTSITFLSFLQATTIPISLASKVPQMKELHQNKETGQLSSIVVFAQLGGTLARVFTTKTETDDVILLWGFGMASIFNAVIAIQYLYYWNGKSLGSLPSYESKKHDGRLNEPTAMDSASLEITIEKPEAENGHSLGWQAIGADFSSSGTRKTSDRKSRLD